MKRSRALVPLLLLGLLLMAAGAGGAWWVLSNGIAHVPLHDQSMAVRLPDGLPVRVEVLQAASAGGMPVRLNETLKLNIELDTEVPLELTVHYQGEIPVRAEVPVDTDIQTQVFGMPMELPIQGTIPLNLNLPVDLTIPIRQPVRLQFSAPITAHVDQIVNIPLSGILDARLRFEEERLIPLRIDDSELALPLDRVWLSGRDPDWRVGPLTADTD